METIVCLNVEMVQQFNRRNVMMDVNTNQIDVQIVHTNVLNIVTHVLMAFVLIVIQGSIWILSVIHANLIVVIKYWQVMNFVMMAMNLNTMVVLVYILMSNWMFRLLIGKCLLCDAPLILVESTGFCQYLKSCEDLIGLYYDKQSNDCLPQCGDGIVAGNEYCDDENNIPNDGCYECKFQCTKNCLICKDGICFECDKGYTLDNNQCDLNKESGQINSSINDEAKKKQ
ncbi:unnamed protein product (macronuclear) [Paramecium tetraurelia]|uniref:Insulin-like growth factor binding protein, N-terminal n=1 Tax=Paramecium tetraurelia TaxID=5888 RepID=A0DUH1_PARTE|nr:uncharacterized protein GSPATT00020360001 [Paramecium tetraurelia]CAK86688.1 unnamed protein product [Paramecium tetraurelia]|eukprot:XP_001454085.1 hypothetical protein (macronuclear) [Paramecium tetraurelia strain d4-2]